ncbi:glycoside hydrolase family 13 protein [Pediococcus siamensis]|uniref:glycoside hydrolase family 13 protein n=1 Tax=Pediococcus siamensis TaxID=381829 RepID=UPI0039A15FA3
MEKHWWQEAVVYQVYPRSFQDTNSDGIGDLNGITQHLDYIKALGATVIWLNPIYQSPNVDNGYDIADYRKIMPEFGRMSDFNRLLKAAHQKGLKIIMDLVVNHTSDEHPWFVESRSDRLNDYRDYYIWRDPKNEEAPNNWQSAFGGSAWQLDDQTGQYYLHLFSKKQPDLNWDNKQVRQSVFEMMRFWLDKGVDGFRMDVINLISKPAGLPDVKGKGQQNLAANGPHVHDYLKEMNQDVLSHYDVMTVGETPGATTRDAIRYTGFDSHELEMVFQFEHMSLDGNENPELGKWSTERVKLTELKQVMSKWQTDLAGKAWNALYWNNHDQPRAVSRFGNDQAKYRVISAKMLGATLHFMQGTPYIYQGEELGMTNAKFRTLDQYQDIESRNAYREFVEEKQLVDPQEMLTYLRQHSRDNARTPMQWDDSDNAGFTTATPWLAVNANYAKINAKQAMADKDSVFYFYQKMNQLRRHYEIIVYGDYQLLDPDDDQVWAYTRHLGNQDLLVISNFTERTVQRWYELSQRTDKIELIGNYPDDQEETLRPYETKVYLIETPK